MARDQSDSVEHFEKLSLPARSAWGKHDRDTESWLPLWRHMADSAAVAGRLWDEWIPTGVKELVAQVLPGGIEDARRLAIWLAASHDIGKATPAFSCQVDSLASKMREAGLEMLYEKQFGADRKRAPHGLAGQLILQEWLSDRHGWSGRASGQFAVVIGGHHGVPPGHQDIHDVDLHPELLRTPGASEETWHAVQFELLDACARVAGVDGRVGEWKSVKLPQPVQVVLTSVVILADWIASSSELFPYRAASVSSSGSGAHSAHLEAAWRCLDLPSPWAPRVPQGTAAELFASRFAFPPGAEIRPVQEEAVRLAREMPASGLLIIEAPMGEGKTEAALAAAEVLAARSEAGGCLVALPTQATGDAMFSRLLTWLDHLPSTEGHSVFLAHAKAALNDEWSGLVRAGSRPITAVDTDGSQSVPSPGSASRQGSCGLQAHQWLRGRKKGLLASFTVGTIDQVLFGGLKSRHLALRHLALAGKVVIIDEVHAYDAYMSTYLERVLEWLAAYGVPVILLSATLPAAGRQALTEAYAGAGSGARIGLPSDTYPLLTAVSPGKEPLVAQPPAASGRGTDIVLEPLDDDLLSLMDRLERELAGGGCALVVRNTVDRVLEAAERLRERFGEDRVTVAHSRFVAADRASKDRDLLGRFGPDGMRPTGPHVVVASQVVEQSLDIDFDLLVTDLAPVDLMLQRMGRLHRHSRRRPARLRSARCLVTGVDWRSDPPEPVRGSLGVYEGRYTLLRSLAVLRPHFEGTQLRLPSDISPLVQAAYGDGPVGPEHWAEALNEAYKDYRAKLADKRARADAFRLGPVRRAGRAVIGWVDAGVGDADETRSGRAQVRDSEESVEVLVIQRRKDGTLTTLPWLDRGRGGRELPEHAVPPRRAAEAVAASALSLPWHFSKPWVIDRTIAELEKFQVAAWQVKECPWLAGELILVLDENCQTRLSGFDLRYSRTDGLLVTPSGARDTRVVDLVPSFDLVSRPWLPIQFLDGTTTELSLRDAFAQAADIRRLVGDVPTQEFALLRLMLAILHDAVEGPEDLDAWEELWETEDPFRALPGYLDRHRARFDLLHPERPFFQVAGLRTEKDEVASLNRIVADVPNGDAFFSMRHPRVESLAFAEAARWLVHAQAFDPSGIKSGLVGDPRVKGGKGYPQGVAWSGNLGGIFAQGKNLRETLLLNLIAADNDFLHIEKDDRPAWRREAPSAAPWEPDPDAPRPSGPRDLYTWQSRRLRLHCTKDAVAGVVLGYGDPLAPQNLHLREPMTGWRRSAPQEKKLGRPLVYMPREHDPSRAAWRGLASLLFAQPVRRELGVQRQEAAAGLAPGVVQWLARLATEEILDRRSLIRTRVVGAKYGTQQSVIDEMVDDGVTLSVVLLHEERPDYGKTAVDAVDDADAAVKALGHLAGNLALAAGSDPGSVTETARDMGFGSLDGPYRQWLRDLGRSPDPRQARAGWQREVHRIIGELGRGLLESAGPATWEGRLVDTREGGTRWIDDSQAELWFRRRLNTVLPGASPRTDEAPQDRVTQRAAAVGSSAPVEEAPDGPTSDDITERIT
ncbi:MULTISPECIES: type I-E CRISPR-associated protein Cse1/CasA [unclassified Streptomyces]|uniref:type I-E CRISPR-associated protein Cse1/CasA n=1 Tax=unclassified Streptomyces TaxID=2593676 RepID=UPI000B86648E|nr:MULTISPECIES: type I-E CRISPR-associated protein Cse1/CasA [unclassified Streptomyces]MYT16176.1 type I-E CRISPR-associated protein Cse1/CasA [Streptomyces sp. SID4951]